MNLEYNEVLQGRIHEFENEGGGGGEGSRYQVLKCTIHVLPPSPSKKMVGGGGGGGEFLTPRNILVYAPEYL